MNSLIYPERIHFFKIITYSFVLQHLYFAPEINGNKSQLSPKDTQNSKFGLKL